MKKTYISKSFEHFISLFRRYNCLFFTLCTLLLTAHAGFAALPIASDSRIKTFVYNENEVFHITVHYGYITSIEFAKNEDIVTIAPGNGYSWKFTKDGRRLFIKALEGAAETNVTIITTKRTYQFELESRSPSDGVDEQLVYVVRFFYPDEMLDKPRPKVDTNRFSPSPPTQSSPATDQPDVSSPFSSAPQAPSAPANPFAEKGDKKKYNFNYTLTGPERIAPLKVFDDGASTLFQFPQHNALIPHFFIAGQDGKETQASYSIKGDYIVLSSVAPQIILRLEADEVRVFNEQYK